MGIDGFYDIVRDKAPEHLIEVKFSELSGYRFAVDASVYLCAYIRSAGPVEWVNLFVQLVTTFKKHGIRADFVFDGPKPPPEKASEREARRAQNAKRKEVLAVLKEIRDALYGETTVSDVQKKEIRTLLRINPETDGINWRDVEAVLFHLDTAIEKIERQTIPITPEFGKKAQEILTALGMPWFQAEGEAETVCAYLTVKCKGFDGVITEDTDVMAYGTPMMVSKVKLSEEKVVVLRRDPLLESLGLTFEAFRDLCILLSCDYNSRIKIWGNAKGKNPPKPVNVGPKRALQLIEEFEHLEIIEPMMVDPEPLKYRRCRQLFSLPKMSGIHLKMVQAPNWKGVEKFLNETGCRYTVEQLKEVWRPKVDIVHEVEPQKTTIRKVGKTTS